MPSGGSVVLRRQLSLPLPYVPPRNAAEQKLAEIWRTVLRMDRVGVDDNYNDLGGDSFIAVLMFVSIEETFDIAIPVATLLSAPTIAELAAEIERLQAAKAAAPHQDPAR